eukprot:snap_masked-scaffold_15-processed-gene-10.31-mRNA-1 protein AED:1.00 eAED:1.00 QI:0/0/0/0/1/1/3/0/72
MFKNIISAGLFQVKTENTTIFLSYFMFMRSWLLSTTFLKFLYSILLSQKEFFLHVNLAINIIGKYISVGLKP